MLLAIVVVAVALGRDQFSVREAQPGTIAETEFSSERAMEHVRAIAQEPRPQGSESAAEARAYIAAELEEMGLTAENQETVTVRTTANTDAVFSASVTNVMARIPGTDSTGTIVVNGHFDSGPNAVGAGDCGSCVAAVLETARALLAGEPLRNDVVLLFADGEETQLFGSRAFVQEHPWAQDVGFALNLESQGTDGPAVFYVSSQGDEEVASKVIEYAPQSAAYSFLSSLIRGLVGGSDLDSFTDEGIPGAGVAFFDTPQYYHTALDNPERLSPDSVQHLGSYTLAVTRGLGNDDLSGSLSTENNSIYFTVWEGMVFSYPGVLVWPLTIIVTLGLGAVVFLSQRRGDLAIRRTMLVAGIGAAGWLLAILAVTAVWALVRIFNADYHVFLVGVTYQDESYLLAFVLMGAAIALAMQFWSGRHANRLETVTGSMLLWWVPLVLCSVLVPSFTALFVWPLLFAIAIAGLTLAFPERAELPWARVAGFGLVAVVTAVLLYPAVLLFQTLGGRIEALAGIPMMGLPTAVAILALLPLFAFAPFARTRSRWTWPLAMGLVAVVLIGWNNATSGFDADHPKPNVMMYQLDADSDSAMWLTTADGGFGRGRSGQLDDWTRQFLGDDPEEGAVAGWSAGPSMTTPGYRSPAPVADLQAPQIDVERNDTDGGTRQVALTLRSPREATNVRVFIDEPVSALTIEGTAANVMELDQSDGLWLHHLALPADGVRIEMTVDTIEPLRLRVDDWSQGLPEPGGFAYEPRPPHMVPSAHDLADTTMVRKTYVIE